MSSFSKTELKRQLKFLGVKVEGNYIKRSDINKVLSEHVKGDAGRTQLGIIIAAVHELEGIINGVNGLLVDLVKLHDDVTIGKIRPDLIKMSQLLNPFRK